jgi:leader peptidase (prepilin peptidase)/N-methyltransferase
VITSFPILLYFLFFVFGSIIGSFLNVVILRLHTGLSINGRSSCFSCGKMLSWIELVPILSFVFQRGRCIGCKSRISFQYPLVEIITGFIFLFTFLKISPSFSPFYLLLTAYYLLIFSLLIIIAVYDFRHKIIPDGIVYFFVLLAFLHIFFEPFQLTVLIAGPVLFLPFFLLWLVSRGRWIGFGDAKLAWGIGWLLGLSAGFSALFVAFYTGALVGVALIVFEQLSRRFSGLSLGGKNFTMKSEVPFGPFLILGVFLVFFFEINFFTSFGF